MTHPYHQHREYQVSHRRVHPLLKEHPAGSTQHATGKAFSNVTSKKGAEQHDAKVTGHKGRKRLARGGAAKHSDEKEDRALIKKMLIEHEKKEGEGYARGGRTKHKGGNQTNVAIVMPKGATDGAGPLPKFGGLPGAGPGVPPLPPGAGPGGPPGMPPGLPPGPPMRASGGRVKKAHGGSIAGESTEANIKKWGKRTAANSYFRGGAATGVGREEKAEHMKRRRK